MVDFAYLEEIMKFENIKGDEEVNKYFISQDLSEKEKINYILKNGFLCQKTSLVTNLRFYTSTKEVFEHILLNLLEVLENWEDETKIEFCKSLTKIFKDLDQTLIYIIFTTELFNRLIIFFIKIISTGEKIVSDEFAKTFSEISQYISANKKIALLRETIDAAIDLGKLGKSLFDKRLCVFFCSQLLQIENTSSDILKDRLILLHADSERFVKREIAYQIRFIAKEKDVSYFIKNILPIISSYMNDNDISTKTEALISVIMNLNKVYDDDKFLKQLIDVLIMFFGNDKLNYKDYAQKTTKIARIILTESQNTMKCAQILEKAVKFIMKKFIFTNERTMIINTAYYFIEEFHLYASYLKNFNEMEDLTELTNILIRSVFEPSAIRINSPSKDIFSKLTQNDLKLAFIDNIESIIKHLPKKIINKHILNNYFSFYESPNNDTIKILLKNLTKMLEFNQKIKNDVFFELLHKYFKNICEWILKRNGDSDLIEWRVKKEILESFRNVELLYNSELFVDHAYPSVLRLLKCEHNYQIQEEAARLIIVLLRFGSKKRREEIINLIEGDYANSTCYYERRLFVPMFQESLKLFSINYLKKSIFFNDFLNFIAGDNSLILVKLLNDLKLVFPLINDDKTIKGVILGIVDTLKKSKVKDIETNFALRKFDVWLESYQQNPRSASIKELISQDRKRQKTEDQELLDVKPTIKFQTNSNLYKVNIVVPGSENMPGEKVKGQKGFIERKKSIASCLGLLPDPNLEDTIPQRKSTCNSNSNLIRVNIAPTTTNTTKSHQSSNNIPIIANKTPSWVGLNAGNNLTKSLNNLPNQAAKIITVQDESPNTTSDLKRSSSNGKNFKLLSSTSIGSILSTSSTQSPQVNNLPNPVVTKVARTLVKNKTSKIDISTPFNTKLINIDAPVKSTTVNGKKVISSSTLSSTNSEIKNTTILNKVKSNSMMSIKKK